MCFAGLSAARKDRQGQAEQSGDTQRRRGKSRNCRSGVNVMARSSIRRASLLLAGFLWAGLVGVSVVSAPLATGRGPPPRRAVLPDKPFADHRLVLQLSDNDAEEAEPGHQRRLQSAEILWAGSDRDRGRDLRSGHRPAPGRQFEPAHLSTVCRAGRALRRVHEHGRDDRTRDRPAATAQSQCRAGRSRRSADSRSLRKRIHTGSALSRCARC